MTPRRTVLTTGLRATLSVSLLLAAASAPTPSRGQAPPPGGGPPPIDRQIQNDRPKFLVRVAVDRVYHMYAEGETLTLKVRCEEDAYLYVLYQQADGKLFQIFPNSGQPDNRIKANQDIAVPAPDDAFRWVIGPPFGHEVVKVIASKKQVDALALPGLREDHFNPVTPEEIAGAGKQLALESPNVWSEHDVAIQTVPRGVSTIPPEAHKRYGVFFGVSNYEFNDVEVEITEGKGKMNLGKAHRDAEDMSRLLKDAGRLSDLRLYRNEEATREQFKTAITEWLPSVSRPGDSVFIFFSGHGTQIADDGNDEKDGLDEALMTTDAFGARILSELLKRQKAGQLAPQWTERVNRLTPEVRSLWQRTYAEAGGRNNDEEASSRASNQVSAYLVRTTGVGDDELGHWVQKLDGRRVVFIVDACRSGGLASSSGAPNKGLKGGGRARASGFDFLKSTFARLKDLNQPTLTVLAACGESESSAELGGQDNGAFTAALLSLIAKSPGPVDASQALAYSRTEIVEQIAVRNKIRLQRGMEPLATFEPQLFTTDTEPVYLKPAP